MRSILLSIGLIGLAACTNADAPNSDARNQAVVKQIYADFASGNIEGFTSALASDVIWNEAENNAYAIGNPYIGVDAVMNDVMSHTFQDWTSFKVTPESYMIDGDQVAMFGRYEATSAATGKSMNPQVVHRWTLKDGKIIGFQQHLDTLAQNEALTPGGAAYVEKMEKETLRNYVTAINSNELDTFMSMLTDDVVFQVPHGPEIVGTEAVREWGAGYYAAYSTNYKKTALDFALNGDMAVERYTYVGVDTNRKTGEVTRDKGKGLVVYRRGADGKWRVSRDAWSTDKPVGE